MAADLHCALSVGKKLRGLEIHQTAVGCLCEEEVLEVQHLTQQRLCGAIWLHNERHCIALPDLLAEPRVSKWNYKLAGLC